METVIRNVRDINSADKQAVEHLLGQNLCEDQQLIIEVRNLDVPVKTSTASDDSEEPALPDWCDVYKGLTDEEIAEIEQVVLNRADLSRSFE